LHKIAEEQKEIANEQRQKSEDLLLNILPKDVADELKEKGASKPVKFDSVTVLFTDFVGFTQIAENLKADELIDELDKCFSYFDAVTKKYNLEKIKTIGDSYMLAAGLPEKNNTHYIDCLMAAMEIRAFMDQMKEIKESQSLPYWELRLGINTGPLVAGVIGDMKFAYDIFGDTVNVASRMESSGFPGKINISDDTYNLAKFLFDCEFRGKIMAKRKGDIPMYFVTGIKKEFSVNGEGKVPNESFNNIYAKLKSGVRLKFKDETL
jgi:class 3 adenylate cyclase